MQNFLSKVHGPLVVLVDISILLSLASDWVAKCRSRKKAVASAAVTTDNPADDE